LARVAVRPEGLSKATCADLV